MRSPPRPQVSLGTEQSGGRQSGSPGEVLPSTVPACEPCSQPRVLQPSGDNAASPAHQGPSEHPTQPHDFRSSTQADFHPWRQQRQPGRAGRGPSALAKHSAREGLTVPPAAAPREVPVPCSGGTWSLSMLQAQRQGRSCASARFRGTQDAALHPRHETPREHALPSLLGQGQGKKKPREQRQKCCQLQLETQLHPKSKAFCAAGTRGTWRSITYSRLGKEQHQEGPR